MSLEYLLVVPNDKEEEKVLTRATGFEKDAIRFEKGLARLEPGAAGLKPGLVQQPREFDRHFKMLEQKIAKGIIMPQDLKLRFSGHRISKDFHLVIAAGPTSFMEYRQAYRGDLPDSELIRELKRQGKELVGDKWAMLARPIGLTAAVIDSEGNFVVGKRAAKSSQSRAGVTEFVEFYHSPAIYLTFTTDLQSIDVVRTAVGLAFRDFYVPDDRITKTRVRLIAAHPETGETDICCIVETNLQPKHFDAGGGWIRAERNSKYVSLTRVKPEDAKRFAEQNNVVYPTAALLARAK